jgi:hypothetical protein
MRVRQRETGTYIDRESERERERTTNIAREREIEKERGKRERESDIQKTDRLNNVIGTWVTRHAA